MPKTPAPGYRWAPKMERDRLCTRCDHFQGPIDTVPGFGYGRCEIHYGVGEVAHHMVHELMVCDDCKPRTTEVPNEG